MKEEFISEREQIIEALEDLRAPVRINAPTLNDVCMHPEAYGMDADFLNASLSALHSHLKGYYLAEKESARLPRDQNIFLGKQTWYDTTMRFGQFSLLEGLISPKVLTLDFMRTYAKLYHEDNAAILYNFSEDRLLTIQRSVGFFAETHKDITPLIHHLPKIERAYLDMRTCTFISAFARDISPKTPLDTLLLDEFKENKKILSWNSPRFQDYRVYEKVIERNMHRLLVEKEISDFPHIGKGLDFAHIHGDLNRLIAAYGTQTFVTRFVNSAFQQNFISFYKSLEKYRTSLSA